MHAESLKSTTPGTQDPVLDTGSWPEGQLPGRMLVGGKQHADEQEACSPT